MRHNLFYILIIILLFSYIYTQKEDNNALKSNIIALNSDIKQYKLKNNQLVTSIESEQYTSSFLSKKILQKDKKIKEISSKFVKTNQIIMEKSELKIDTIIIPKQEEGTYNTQWYNFDYKIDTSKISIHNFMLKDSLIIVSGEKRKWFLGKKTTIIDITHSNPNIYTTEIRHIEIKENKKFYDTRLFNIGVGVVCTLFFIK